MPPISCWFFVRSEWSLCSLARVSSNQYVRSDLSLCRFLNHVSEPGSGHFHAPSARQNLLQHSSTSTKYVRERFMWTKRYRPPLLASHRAGALPNFKPANNAVAWEPEVTAISVALAPGTYKSIRKSFRNISKSSLGKHGTPCSVPAVTEHYLSTVIEAKYSTTCRHHLQRFGLSLLKWSTQHLQVSHQTPQCTPHLPLSW